jgi:tRNA (cytidine/uridine-2'-O-)-methyltransferase
MRPHKSRFSRPPGRSGDAPIIDSIPLAKKLCCAHAVTAMRLALYQPDIPQNAGALIRLGACLGVPVDVIEPCGFLLGDRSFRRAGMDYLALADWHRHASWDAFLAARAPSERHDRFAFAAGDTLLLGRESAGAPEEVHRAADARLRVALRPDARSLNVALAAAIVLGEALRQTNGFPED